MEKELFPIVSGLAVGIVLGLVAPRLQIWVGAVAAIVLGALATFVSGEFEISWAFLLIDIPMVAIASIVGFLVMRRLRIGSWTVQGS